MERVIAMNDADDIVKEFLVESYENLDRLDRDLITLEKNPGDRDILASVFRTIHTIGASYLSSGRDGGGSCAPSHHALRAGQRGPPMSKQVQRVCEQSEFVRVCLAEI